MIRMKIGPESADKFFSQARYVVCMGSNDYINNYLLPVYADSWTYTGDSFTNYVISTLDSQLRVIITYFYTCMHACNGSRNLYINQSQYIYIYIYMRVQLLYALGARKVAFFGLGPMGCIPLQRLMSSDGNCRESTNKLSKGFNKAALQLLNNLTNILPNSSFVFGDAYDYFQDIIDQPEKHGLYVVLLTQIWILYMFNQCKVIYDWQ